MQILVIGNTTLDTFLFLKEADLHSGVHSGATEICFRYGDKIPVDFLQKEMGGNAANVAVGLARTGIDVALQTVLGDDEIGRNLYERLRSEDVNLSYTTRESGTLTDTSYIICFKNERTIFPFHEAHAFKLAPLSSVPTWVYLTTLPKNHAPFVKALLEYCQKHHVKLAFNPGDLQLRARREELLPILLYTEILFVNKEEASRIVKKKTLSKIETLALHLFDQGPRIAVVTDGKKGACAYDGRQIVRQTALPAQVLEMTGAGDAFSAGFLAAHLRGLSLKEALGWGSTNSASVIEYVGAQKGLLNEEKIKIRAQTSSQ